jgi:hypothetical protein
MILISKYKNNIIETRIFSWWVALLNTNTDKFVIAPSKWFNASIYISNLIPQEWLLF